MDPNRLEQTIYNLRQNGFQVHLFKNTADAREAILQQIPLSATVGFGGSMTLFDMGIYEALEARGNSAFWHWHEKPGHHRKEVLRSAACADIYLSGINAITEEGRLINIDGNGNRLSGILYGHDRTILVAGVNKIVKNYEEALIRIKNIACPPNARRLGRKTPCAETGSCMNCSSPDRICTATLILDRQPGGVPIEIFLVEETLGY